MLALFRHARTSSTVGNPDWTTASTTFIGLSFFLRSDLVTFTTIALGAPHVSQIFLKERIWAERMLLHLQPMSAAQNAAILFTVP
jgi:hypothetical protein